jgi:hypothetical protein
MNRLHTAFAPLDRQHTCKQPPALFVQARHDPIDRLMLADDAATRSRLAFDAHTFVRSSLLRPGHAALSALSFSLILSKLFFDKALVIKMSNADVLKRLDRAMNRNGRLEYQGTKSGGKIWLRHTANYGGKIRRQWVFSYTLTPIDDETLLVGRYRAPLDSLLYIAGATCIAAYHLLAKTNGFKVIGFSSRTLFAMQEPNLTFALVLLAAALVLVGGPELYQAIAKREAHRKEEEEILTLLRMQLDAKVEVA